MLLLGFALVLIGVATGLAFMAVYGILVLIDRVRLRRRRAAKLAEVRAIFDSWQGPAGRPPAGRHRRQPDTGRHHLRQAA